MSDDDYELQDRIELGQADFEEMEAYFEACVQEAEDAYWAALENEGFEDEADMYDGLESHLYNDFDDVPF